MDEKQCLPGRYTLQSRLDVPLRSRSSSRSVSPDFRPSAPTGSAGAASSAGPTGSAGNSSSAGRGGSAGGISRVNRVLSNMSNLSLDKNDSDVDPEEDENASTQAERIGAEGVRARPTAPRSPDTRPPQIPRRTPSGSPDVLTPPVQRTGMNARNQQRVSPAKSDSQRLIRRRFERESPDREEVQRPRSHRNIARAVGSAPLEASGRREGSDRGEKLSPLEHPNQERLDRERRDRQRRDRERRDCKDHSVRDEWRVRSRSCSRERPLRSRNHSEQPEGEGRQHGSRYFSPESRIKKGLED